MITLKELTKVYKNANDAAALGGVSFTLGERGLVFFTGKSGCGKTTLLNIIGGLDSLTDGDMLIDGVSVRDFSSAQYDSYRNSRIGFIFQEYNLLDELTVAENIALALELQNGKATAERINTALESVDLAGCGDRKPDQLSGGQRQRVAIARALVKSADIIIADEPTGALDSENSRQVFEILKRLSRERLVIVASHDSAAAEEYADRIITLSDGMIAGDSGGEDTEQPSCKNAADRRNRLPDRIALRLALNSVKRKKLRLAAVILLSVFSLTLVGAADAFASYSRGNALLRALCDGGGDYVSVKKEAFREYEGVSGWYGDGYMITPDELDALGAKTGRLVKGVYKPPFTELTLELNYASTVVTAENYNKYMTAFSGFAELAEGEPEQLGMELIAGRLPDGNEPEIAISKYAAESFVGAGYRFFTGPEIVVTHFSEDMTETEEKEFITWDEWVQSPEYDPEKKTVLIDWENTATETALINAPDEMIGKTIFLGERNYTVTGIIDTGFDSGRYAGAVDRSALEKSEKPDLKQLIKSGAFERERDYGVETLAFVGKGRIAEIASRYPSVVSLGDGKLNIENKYGLSFSTGSVARIGGVDMKKTGGLLYEPDSVDKLADNDIVTIYNAINMVPLRAANPGVSDEELKSNLKLLLTYADGRTSYYTAGQRIITYIYPGRGGDGHLYPTGDTVIVSDAVFDALADGREGLYSFALVSLPRDKDGIKRLLGDCSGFSESARFAVMNAVTFQMDALEDTVSSAARISGIIGIALAVFAAALMFNFISVSITQKKRQIGIMRAMGARGADVFRVFLYESLFIAAVNTLLACALTAALSAAANTVLAGSFGLLFPLMTFGPRQIGIIAALGFGIALLSSFIPIAAISRQKPIDAIRQ